MRSRKLSLDDDAVVRIVEALNAYEGRSFYDLSDGAVTLKALAPLVERYDAIKEAHREAHRREYRASTDRSGPEAERERRISASSVVLLLGHPYPLIQGTSCECQTCGMTGALGTTLIGDLFRERCRR